MVSINEASAPQLANPVPGRLLQLNRPFTLTVPTYSFLSRTGLLTYSASLGDGSPLPSWLSFDAATRTLRGTPPLAGTLNVRFTATNSEGESISDTIPLSIGISQFDFNAGGDGAYGDAQAIAVDGNLAFLATGHVGLSIINTSQPATPTSLARLDTPGYARDVAFSGGYAFLAASDAGLQVIDGRNPTSPSLVFTLDTDGYANGITVDGTRAYIADWNRGLLIVEISNPVQPIVIGRLELSGTAMNVAVSGKYAYVASSSLGIQIVDVSDPQALRVVGSFQTAGSAYGVTVAGTQAFVTSSNGVEILDVANPAAPVRISRYSFPEEEDIYYIKGPILDGNRLYVSTRNSGVHVLDISTPSAPQLLTIHATSEANDLAIVGNSVLVADGYRLTVLDRVSIDATPAKSEPLVVGSLAGRSAYEGQPFQLVMPSSLVVDPGDKLVYTASLADGSPLPGWIAFDSATRTFSGTPVGSGTLNVRLMATDQEGQQASDSFLLSVLSGHADAYGTGDVIVAGHYAFFASAGNLAIADIRDPKAIQIPRFVPLQGYSSPEAMALGGGFVYLAKPYSGLQIVDVRDPLSPVVKGGYADTGYVTSVATWGRYALLGATYGAVKILDISNPDAPALVQTFQVGGDPFSIKVQGNLALVSFRNWGGMAIYDLNDIANPRQLSQLYLRFNMGTANDFIVNDKRVYVAGQQGLLILDISDPTNPVQVGDISLPLAWQRSISAAGSFVYLSGADYQNSGAADVHVIDVSDPTAPRLIAAYQTPGSAYGIASSSSHAFVAGTKGLDSLPLHGSASVNDGSARFSLSGRPEVGNTLSV
jgi:hypothetical protein